MKRSKFSLSHHKLTTCKQGQIVPLTHYEVLPGDTVQQATSALVRVAPLVAPVMHPVHAKIHHWFVPYRLIWEDWEKFITGGSDGEGDGAVFPTITVSESLGESTLADYLGIPSTMVSGTISALPFRAYSLIWNEFYRDQDLQTALTIDKTSGTDSTTNMTLQHAAWDKDYFTTARPWAQKGPEVTVPVHGIGMFNQTYAAGPTTAYETGGETASYADYKNPAAGGADNTVVFEESTTNPGYPDIRTEIAEMRLAFALQRYEEARARYGSRYTEYLRYLGVRSSDARLQRPEYLGGGKQTIQFSEVLQTAPDAATGTSAAYGVGNLKGHGIGAMRSNRYRRFFEEHGIVLSFIIIKPVNMYMQNLDRHWLRRTKEDFWQKELQFIGQQEITNREIKVDHASPSAVFGYQDRYDEYRHMASSVSGEFRNTASGGLDDWHFARNFSSDPTLNGDFVKCVPTTRTYAQTWEDQMWIMAYHSIQARRQVAASGGNSIVL